jgi:hypothetical protein
LLQVGAIDDSNSSIAANRDRLPFNWDFLVDLRIYTTLKNFTNLYHRLGLAYTTKAKLNPMSKGAKI